MRCLTIGILIPIAIFIGLGLLGFFGAREAAPSKSPAARAAWHLRKAEEHIEAAERALRERRRNQLPTRREIVA